MLLENAIRQTESQHKLIWSVAGLNEDDEILMREKVLIQKVLMMVALKDLMIIEEETAMLAKWKDDLCFLRITVWTIISTSFNHIWKTLERRSQASGTLFLAGTHRHSVHRTKALRVNLKEPVEL